MSEKERANEIVYRPFDRTIIIRDLNNFAENDDGYYEQVTLTEDDVNALLHIAELMFGGNP